MSAEEADPTVVAKMIEEGLEPGAIPIASLTCLWYLEPDGRDGFVTKFDGQLRVSITVGDLMGLIQRYLWADEQDQDDG